MLKSGNILEMAWLMQIASRNDLSNSIMYLQHLTIRDADVNYNFTDYRYQRSYTKNVIPLTCYNIDIHDPITMIFAEVLLRK